MWIQVNRGTQLHAVTQGPKVVPTLLPSTHDFQGVPGHWHPASRGESTRDFYRPRLDMHWSLPLSPLPFSQINSIGHISVTWPSLTMSRKCSSAVCPARRESSLWHNVPTHIKHTHSMTFACKYTAHTHCEPSDPGGGRQACLWNPGRVKHISL